MSLKHIKIFFYQQIQPCDQGIMKILKLYNCKQMQTKIIDNIENANHQQLSANELAKQTNLLDALHYNNNGLGPSDRYNNTKFF